MKKLVFATNNTHKLKEVKSMLKDRFEIISLREIGCNDEIPETSDTLEGNALQKAQWIKSKYGYDCFADDTGLETEALNGAPGVYSARYAGEDVSYTENNLKLLKELKGQTNRKAAFRTVICLIMNGKTHFFEGKINGTIIEESKGKSGFGYDPVFVPKGYKKTFSELGDEVKNKISHRAKAVKLLVEFLRKEGDEK